MRRAFSELVALLRRHPAPHASNGRPTWQLLAEEGRAPPPLPVSRLRREMAAAAELAYGLGEDARDYAIQLETHMVDLAENAALRGLLGATRTMILRAEAAERLIRKCGDEVDLLRRAAGRGALSDDEAGERA